jgi:carboxyl-terminal processing protease
MFRKKKLVFGTLLFAGGLGLATTLTNDFEIVKNLEIFSNIFRDVNVNYVDEIDPEKMMESGLNSMLQYMDPYTVYIPANELDQFQSSISGHYAGMGAAVITVEGYAVITEVYENAPAFKAGLRAGDKLISADGKSLKSLSVQDVSSILRGSPGSKVKVEYQRPGKGNNFVEITREEVFVNNTPFYDILPGDVAYIALTTFSENAGKNVNKALLEMKRQKNLKAVILDLRGNTGGLLNEAVNVTNVFVPKGVQVVSIKGKDKEKQQIYRTLNQTADAELPLVILIDEQSASASEIVAGAIQDLDRGVIIGQKSFGKGLVQTTKDLPFGAKLKITTARYYIPSGRCIQATQYKDGKPLMIADSLREKFKTQAGRIVLDGGGILPDIATGTDELKILINSLNSNRLFFEFAVDYIQNNKVASPESFKLEESIFKEFLSFLDRKNFNQLTSTELSINNFEKKAKAEGISENINPLLEDVKNVIKKEKIEKLSKYKKEILFELQHEIAEQIHMKKGALKNSVLFDPEIQIALETLNNRDKYSRILTK